MNELLTIDVDAEIRKLCERQLGGTAEQIIELGRMCFARGARSLSLSISRAGVQVAAPGAQFSDEVIELMACVRDDTNASERRHAALIRIEALGPGLLAILAQSRCSIGINGMLADFDGTSTRRGARTGGAAEFSLPLARPNRAERNEIGQACRFARLPITINAVRVDSARLRDVIVQVQANVGGRPALVGLPLSPHMSHLVALRHELVAREVFSAPKGGRVVTAVFYDEAALARGSLIRARDELYTYLGQNLHQCEAGHFDAACRLLLKGANADTVEALRGVRMFERVDGVRTDWTELIDGDSSAVWAVEPRRAKHFRSLAARVFVLTPEQRTFISESLGWRIAQPPAQQPSWQRVLIGVSRRAALAVSTAVRSWVGRLGRTREVPEHALNEAERSLLRGAQHFVSEGLFCLPRMTPARSSKVVVRMHDGRAWPPRVVRQGAERYLMLPRRSPRVAAAAIGVHRDERLLYPAMLSLLDGHDGYGERRVSMQRVFLGR